MADKALPVQDLFFPSPHHPPTLDEVQHASDNLNCPCSPELLKAITETAGDVIKSLDTVDKLQGFLPQVKYPRCPGRKPLHHENLGNAWAWLCDIQGDTKGKLKGKTVAIKDNVAVAGVPMSNGSRVLEGYVPEYDATIVTRILDAGGRILGKSSCDDFCASAMGFSSVDGGFFLPQTPGHRVGGSSGGSAILVATGKVDLAIAGDQGGSIRIPSAWSGVVGLKPTFGLVPYTGIVPVEPTIDHVGPVARNVSDCALFLEVLAGTDGLDPRQKASLDLPQYSKLLEELKSFKIGIVKEGFEKCDPNVQLPVRQLIEKVSALDGINTVEMTVPLHAYGHLLLIPILIQGGKSFMETGCHFYDGFYSTSLVKAVHQGIKCASNYFSPGVKEKFIIGDIMKKRYGNQYYAKARNITLELRRQYNEALEKCDVILMPTLTSLPTKWLTDQNATTEVLLEHLKTSASMSSNTRVFNLTGHPALTIPLGKVGDPSQPGLMIVGKHFDEVKVLQVGRALEKIVQDSLSHI